MDKITLAVIQKKLESIAEEMATVLRMTALSPNIKERADFSTAVFTSDGGLLAQAEAIPVHLGSMSTSVKEGLKAFKDEFYIGDIIIHNSPFRGGTHLPDITLIKPVFLESDNSPSFFVANRAHHADIGGIVPGSMPGASTQIFQEGLSIPPVKIVDRGKIQKNILNLILENVRTPLERKGDFMAQIGSVNKGEERVKELAMEYGTDKLFEAQKLLFDMTKQATHNKLRQIPEGSYEFEDFLDSDGVIDNPVKIKVKITISNGEATVDFTGTAKQVQGNTNAPLAVTRSAVFYVFRCITGDDVPANEGGFSPIKIVAPVGTVVNPNWPAAVSSGNTETSQRIVDVVFGALSKAISVPAASQGTMNNVLIGGIDPNTNKSFSYYETIGGGTGATNNCDGENAIHSHMTNTWNTPIEALELEYPLRVTAYKIRENSGGKGKHRGGNGIIREYLFLTDVEISLQTERRKFSPWGLKGGMNASRGKNLLIKQNGEVVQLPGRITISAKKGERLRIETPGGGGYGNPNNN